MDFEIPSDQRKITYVRIQNPTKNPLNQSQWLSCANDHLTEYLSRTCCPNNEHAGRLNDENRARFVL